MEVLHQVLRSVLPHRLRPGPEELPDRVRGEGKVRLPEPQLRAGELREAREGAMQPSRPAPFDSPFCCGSLTFLLRFADFRSLVAQLVAQLLLHFALTSAPF